MLDCLRFVLEEHEVAWRQRAVKAKVAGKDLPFFLSRTIEDLPTPLLRLSVATAQTQWQSQSGKNMVTH